MSDAQGHDGVATSLFKNAEGRTARLREISRTEIGKGNYGVVYRVNVAVLDDNGKERGTVFVLKEFHPYNVPLPPEENKAALKKVVERAFNNHTFLKKAGITTWTTYRLNTLDGTSILMTDGELAETDYLISSSHTNPSISREAVEGKVASISNLEEAVANAIKDLHRACTAKIAIATDAWLYRIRMEGADTSMHILVGDLDCIVQYTETDETASWDPVLNNAISLLESLDGVLRFVLTPGQIKPHVEKVRNLLMSEYPRLIDYL